MNGRFLRHRRWRVGLSTAFAILVAGCTFGPDEQARPVDDAPVDLLQPTTTETIATDVVEDEGFTMTLMFIDSQDRRVAVTRQVESRPSVQDVLDALANQPVDAESAAHPESPIRSALFGSLNPQDAGVEDGQLRVLVEGEELRQATVDIPGRVRLIYGQIVCSIAELETSGIDRVVIDDAEGTIQPPTEEVEVVTGGVGPDKFNDCITAEEIAAAEGAAAAEDESTTTMTR